MIADERLSDAERRDVLLTFGKPFDSVVEGLSI